jgi:hypothetical protein
VKPLDPGNLFCQGWLCYRGCHDVDEPERNKMLLQSVTSVARRRDECA